jgi:hypothetical protein
MRITVVLKDPSNRVNMLINSKETF